MALLIFDIYSISIVAFLFVFTGVLCTFLWGRVGAMRVGLIAEIYQERNKEYYQVKRKGFGAGEETFNVGERQFVIDPSKVWTYEQWNRWGGACPVLRYDLRDAKPLEPDTMESGTYGTVLQKDKKFYPLTLKFNRLEKPSSASVNLIFRRGGLKAMIQSTRNVAMDPKIVGIMCAVAGMAAGYLIFNNYHPGLIPGPPAGYFFKPFPIPTNVTAVTTG